MARLWNGKNGSRGFTLVEIMVAIAIIGILAAISIPNYRIYKDKAERASVYTTLKYLMDGADIHLLNDGGNLTVNVPKGSAREIPELAYNFSEGHKNRYRIRVRNRPNRVFYRIDVYCDFDSNGNNRDDRFRAMTDIRRGEVRKNREVVQLR
jgi:prepilin-type N-terminal cleavage/methylation domain-containing protein